MPVTKAELWQQLESTLARVHEVEEQLRRRDSEHSEQVAKLEYERDAGSQTHQLWWKEAQTFKVGVLHYGGNNGKWKNSASQV